MANSTQVIAIDAGNPPIVSKTLYRGNVQAIPVDIASQDAGTAEVTKALPDPCWVIASHLVASAGDPDLGYTGATTAVGTGATSILDSYTAVDVSGKTLIVTTSETSSVSGYILIVTEE